MKNIFRIFIWVCLFILNSCSNNNTPSPQPAPTNNSSKTILYDVNNPFDGGDDDYCFMLLGPDNSAQKKYFKAIMIDVVKDSMKITEGPYTLDSLIDVSTFPSYIKSANSGLYLTDFVFADSIRMRQIGSNNNGKRSFTQANWNAYESNFVKSYAKGKQIEGTTLNYIKIPTSSGGYTGYSIHFFFKQSKCIVYQKKSSSSSTTNYDHSVEDISSIIGASYDWQNIDNYFQVFGASGTTQHYFIDYKNWRYFRIKETKTSVPGTSGGQHAIEYGEYKSLDKLLKWPEDWKK
jgi:hypothetical protein